MFLYKIAKCFSTEVSRYQVREKRVLVLVCIEWRGNLCGLHL